MSHDLLPFGLAEAARRAELEPFELVRLTVASGLGSRSLEFNADQLAELCTFAGVERWWADRSPTQDPKHKRGLLKAVLTELLVRKHVGDARTRQDNLWRGLPDADRRFLEEAIDLLVEHGLVSLRAEATGVLLSARPDAVDRLQQMAQGKSIPEDLGRLCA
jgi:hypothetical protein